MASLKPKSLLDLPDEVLDDIIVLLTFNDLCNIRKVNKRLEDCQKRVSKKKPFSKYFSLKFLAMETKCGNFH